MLLSVEAATPEEKADQLKKAMLQLRSELRENHFFSTPRLAYIRTGIELTGLLLGWFWLLSLGGTLAPLGGMVLLALYYQQSAWLGHDIEHGQLISNKKTRTFAAGLMSWSQGLSASWWKDKHGKHHATPNAYTMKNGVIVPLDDDINTMPWLIWDTALLTPEQQDKYRKWMRWQGWALGGMLFLAHLHWSMSGFIHAVRNRLPMEGLGIAFHYAAMAALTAIIFPGPVWLGLAWYLGAQLLGGFMLSLVFILNHSGMDVYHEDDALNFFEAQIRSTRNVNASWLANWFTGGLNLQLEHHLYPNLPRHNLPKVQQRIRQIVEKSGYEYQTMPFFTACTTVWSTLPKGI
jgi:fatty acid desaturase